MKIEAVSTPTQDARPRARSEARPHRLTRPATGSLAIAAVAGLTAVGLALRVANLGESFIGDELSTLWILDRSTGLGDLLSSIRSNDEITPPLYFVLAWLAMKLGPEPEWLRLPSLIAGTVTIPMVYVLGLRTVGRVAGLIGAAVIALSPFMIYYSTEARAYALMIALVAGSTLALLAAVETRRARWWAVYAVCSLGALFSHYTCAFVLAAQFAWVLLAHRDSARPLFLANLGVLAGFAPWIPGFIADNTSPTTEILSRLVPFTLDGVSDSITYWAIGYPYIKLEVVPGDLATVLLAAGLGLALVAAAVRGVGWLRRSDAGIVASARRAPPRVILIVMLALATAAGEIFFSAIGSDIIGSRNLNASWPALALTIGALLTAAGPLVGVLCAAAVLTGFAVGAAKTLDSASARVDSKGAADVIEARWEPGDVIVDTYFLTPVPLTALDVYLPQTNPEYRLGLPLSDEPFAFGDPVPPPDRLINEALEAGKGRSIFLVAPLPGTRVAGGVSEAEALQAQRENFAARFLARAEPKFEITHKETVDGLAPIAVFQLQEPPTDR